MELIKEIILKDPPTKWTLNYKKEKFDSKGKKVTKQDFYLTANLFYADRTSYHITSKIIKECKEYLFSNIKYVPELEKCRIELEYRHTKEIDLDNKAYFWIKLLLDILKIPTKRQIDNATLKGKEIITFNSIYDDTTKQIDDIRMKFERGEHCMIIRIYGRLKPQQEQMDLFFK
tara:strand:+ start:1106 stop:1627 length:522 start_codon:yes stop_codon:yes gene_type:complete